jgi:hypothetical protein
MAAEQHLHRSVLDAGADPSADVARRVVRMGGDPPAPTLGAGTDPSAHITGAAAFYASALAPGVRDRYRQALAAHGLDGEIAVLRLRLYEFLNAEASAAPPPGVRSTDQILRLIDLLIKALRVPTAHGREDQLALEHAFDQESLRVLALQK